MKINYILISAFIFTTLNASQNKIKEELHKEELHSAIHQNDFKKAKKLIKLNKIDINSEFNTDGDTALHIAISNKQLDFVRWLLEQGANPNKPNKHNFTPLHMAVLLESFPIVKILIEEHAAIKDSAESTEGYTPLHTAIAIHNVTITKYLLEREPNPNILSKKNETPLAIAFMTSQLCSTSEEGRSYFDKKRQIITLLMNNPQTNINFPDINGNSVLLTLPQMYAYWHVESKFDEKQILQLLDMLINHPQIDLTVKTKKNKTIQDIISCLQREITQDIIVSTERKTSETSSFINSLLEKTLHKISNPTKKKECEKNSMKPKELEKDLELRQGLTAQEEASSWKGLLTKFHLEGREISQREIAKLNDQKKSLLKNEGSERLEFLQEYKDATTKISSYQQKNKARLLAEAQQKADHAADQKKDLLKSEVSNRREIVTAYTDDTAEISLNLQKDTTRLRSEAQQEAENDCQKFLEKTFTSILLAQSKDKQYLQSQKSSNNNDDEFNSKKHTIKTNIAHHCPLGRNPLVCAFSCHTH